MYTLQGRSRFACATTTAILIHSIHDLRLCTAPSRPSLQLTRFLIVLGPLAVSERKFICAKESAYHPTHRGHSFKEIRTVREPTTFIISLVGVLAFNEELSSRLPVLLTSIPDLLHAGKDIIIGYTHLPVVLSHRTSQLYTPLSTAHAGDGVFDTTYAVANPPAHGTPRRLELVARMGIGRVVLGFMVLSWGVSSLEAEIVVEVTGEDCVLLAALGLRALDEWRSDVRGHGRGGRLVLMHV